MREGGPAPSGDTALFVSDAHLGAGRRDEARAREALFLDFLARRAMRARNLFILGDLFDFWFEYRHTIPRHHLDVVLALRRLVAAGVRVTYFGGNHDFWVGSFLREEVGAVVYDDPTHLELDGRRLFLMHGDGMARGDRGYKLLKGLLRNPLAIQAYRWIHPDLGIPFAMLVSRLSRSSRDESRVDREWLYRQLALPHFAQGADAVLCGHYHHPTHFQREGRDFLILGDWIENDTFASLVEGRFVLERWDTNGGHVLDQPGRDYPESGADLRAAR